MSAWLEPTQDSGHRFVQRGLTGPVVMLNLLRFRTIANPDLAPAAPISGAEAFDCYIQHSPALAAGERRRGPLPRVGRAIPDRPAR